MSAIKSLLNMAALRSRTDDLVACQLGSPVSMGLNVPLWVEQLPAALPLLDPLVLLLLNPLAPPLIPVGIQNDVELRAPGEASGEDGALHGCVTCMLFSRCTRAALLCGGDNNSGPLFSVSTRIGKRTKNLGTIFKKYNLKETIQRHKLYYILRQKNNFKTVLLAYHSSMNVFANMAYYLIVLGCFF